jgi:hypothetical protein
MNKKQVKELFDKYINNECSPEELRLLDSFLDSFQDKDSLWSELHFEEDIKEKIWSRIRSKTCLEQKSNKRNYGEILKYAAILIGIAVWGYAWHYMSREEKSALMIEENVVVLKMDGNLSKKINEHGQQLLKNEEGEVIASQEGDLLVYKPGNSVKELIYNEIQVPKGKKFELLLSDGTLIHLNSDTSLKFPVNFVSGEERKVFLNGEAYFEVTRDIEHPFSVVTDAMNVQVLGTHFNVSSYKGSGSYTVLAEGSVVVYNPQKANDKQNPQQIIPGQKASMTDEGIQVDEVNVADYMGWRDGNLILINETFMEIVNRIERQYNVDIDNRFRELDSVRFNGKFENETITELLDTFKESAGFEYRITDNTVIINQP